MLTPEERQAKRDATREMFIGFRRREKARAEKSKRIRQHEFMLRKVFVAGLYGGTMPTMPTMEK